MNGPIQTCPVVLQAPVHNHILCSLDPVELALPQSRENSNAGYAPLLEVVGPFQVQNDPERNEAQAVGTSAPERLRRLARRYVNNPESVVNGVHLEPGPSGQFQVVITIDITITGILGDAIN